MPTIISGSTGISGTDGTAATPAVQGTDTNTGIFFPANDTIAFAEGGTEVMRIDNFGRLGIGTSSPQAAAVVSNAGAAGLELFTNYPGGGVGTYIQSFNRSTAAYVNTAYDAADHSFRISGTERMRIDVSGRVTKPAQPAFNATIPFSTNAALWPDNNTNFVNYVSTHLNRGSHFNATNGRFTAPVAGAYLFCASLTASSGVGTDLNDYQISINDTPSENYSPPTVLTYPSSIWQAGSITVVLNLAVNDFVTVRRTCCNNNKPGGLRMNFMGCLIG